MRREVIQKLLEAEREAQAIVESARREADRIVADAQREAREVITRGKQEVLGLKRTRLEAALAGIESEKENRLARAMVEIEEGGGMNEDMRQRLVAAVVRCACGLQPNQEGG